MQTSTPRSRGQRVFPDRPGQCNSSPELPHCHPGVQARAPSFSPVLRPQRLMEGQVTRPVATTGRGVGGGRRIGLCLGDAGGSAEVLGSRSLAGLGVRWLPPPWLA